MIKLKKLFFILGFMNILLISCLLIKNVSYQTDNNKTTLENSSSFDEEVNIDEESNRTKLASSTHLSPGETITIQDNHNIYWDIIGDSSGDIMKFSSKNPSTTISNVWIPMGDTYTGIDVDSNTLYSFVFTWGINSMGGAFTVTGYVYVSEDVSSESYLNFTYGKGNLRWSDVGRQKSDTYKWYPKHDHEWRTTSTPFQAHCLDAAKIKKDDCLYCPETEIIASGSALGHNSSTTGTYGIFKYTTCSRDGWTNSNGTFTSSANIRNTDQYSAYVDGWESVITLSFSLSAKSNIKFTYLVSSESDCDELYVLLDGTNKLTASGEETKSFTISNVTTGNHTLVFKYIKDSSADEGQDLARISSLSVESAQSAGYVNLSATSGSVAYGTASKTFTVSSYSGTLSVTDNNATATVSITGTTVTISNLAKINAGTKITVTVKAAESTSYTAASATYTLTITQAAGKVTLSATSGSATYGTANKTFTATTNAGALSVTDDNATATVAINSGTITISNLAKINAGTKIKVTVSAAASTNYKAASAVYTLTITQATGKVTLSAASASVAYGTANKTFTATTNAGALSVTDDNATAGVAINSGTVTISNLAKINAGTKIKVTVSAAASTNYTAASAVYTLTITQAAGKVTLSPTSGSVVYGTANKTFTATTNAGVLTVTDDHATATVAINNGTVTISTLAAINAGTTIKVTVSAAASTNYTAASAVYTLTITKKDINPSVSMTGYIYAGTKTNPSVSGNTGNGSVAYYYSTSNTNTGGTAWSTVTSSTSLNAGTYYMYAVIVATTNYNGKTTAAKQFTISQATGKVTLSAASASVAYGTASKTFTATTNAGTLSVTDDNATATVAISNGTVTISNLAKINAGTTIKVTVNSAATTNYTAASAIYTLSITQAAGKVTLSPTSGSVVYGTTSKNFTATTNAGALTVTDDHATATVAINNGTVTISTLAAINAGTTIKVTVSAAASTNYKAASAVYTLTITKKDINPSVSMTGYTYAGTKTNPSVSGNTGKGSVTYYYSTSNATTGGAEWSKVTNSTSLNAGTYYMYAVINATTNYNGKTTAAKQFTISQATGKVTLSPTNGSVVYGTASKTFAATTNAGALTVTDDNATATVAINSGTVTISTLSAINAGTTIKVTVSAAASTNYTAASAIYTLTITKASLVRPTASTTVYTYIGNGQTYTPTGYNSATMNITGNTRKDAGSQDVTVSLKNTTNYQWNDGKIDSVTFTFEINKAELTLTLAVANQTTTYNGNSASITNSYTKSASGLKGTDKVDVVTIGGMAVYKYISASYTANTVAPTNAGSYTIALSGLSASADNYTVTIKYTNGTLTIKKATGKVTLSPTNGSVVYGTASKTFTATTNSGTLSVTDDHATATVAINNGTVTISTLAAINAGTTIKVTVSAAASTNYTAASAVYTLTITKKDINPSVSMTGYTYAGTKTSPSVSGNTGKGTVTYYYSTSNTNTGGTEWSKVTSSTSLNAGTYYMYAVIDATTNYNGKTTAAKQFTISQATGKVTLSPTSGSVVYGTGSTTFTATTNSGTLSVTDDNATAIVAINNGTVTISTLSAINAGTAIKVTVSAAESTNYTAASAIYTLTITKASLVRPTASTTVYTYNGNNQTYTPTGYNSETMNITGNTRKDAGSQDVTVSLKNTTNYQWNDGKIDSVTFTFTINSKNITVEFSDYENLVYNKNEQQITVNLKGVIDGDTCTIKTMTGNKGKNAGDYTCEVTEISNPNYALSGTTTLGWSIAKYQVEKPVEDTTVYTYTGEDQTYQVESSEFYTVSNQTQKEAGTYTVTITLNDTDNYEWTDKSIEKLEYSFRIQPKAVDIIWSENTFTYNGEEQDKSGIIAYYLTLPSSTRNYLTVRCNSESFKLAATYTFSVELDDTKNYTVANSSDSHNYTIDKASITLQAEDKSSAYGASLEALTYTVASGTNYNAEITPVLTTTATTTSNVGTYPITITASNNDNYDITLINGEYEIAKKAIEVTILDQFTSYTGEEPVVDQTAYETEETGDLGVVITKEAGVTIGEYKLTATSSNTNYVVTFIYTNGDHSIYAIEKESLKITVTNYNGEYDKNNHSGAVLVADVDSSVYTIYYSTTEKLTEENYSSASTTNPSFTDVGKTTVYFYIVANDYKNRGGSFTVEITKKEVTVTFSGYEGLVYDSTEKTITVRLDGILEGDTCTITGITGDKNTKAGGYTCEVTEISNSNYVLSGTTTLDWSIAKYQVEKPSEDSATYTYNGEEQSYQVDSSAYYTVSNQTHTNAGSYIVTISLNDVDNYEWTDQTTEELNYTFTIAPKEVELTAENKSSAYNDALVELTYAITSGNLYEEIDIKLSTTATTTSNVGDYPITITATNDNYDITLVAGTYTITMATPIITNNPTASEIMYGNTLSNSILSNGQASVEGSFSWVNPNTIPPVGTNEYEVIFTPIDSINYNAVTISASVTVNELPKDDNGDVKVDDDNYDDLKDLIDDYDKLPEEEKNKLDDKTKEDIDKIRDAINQYEEEHGLPVTPSVITSPVASDIMYGNTLSNSMLTGGAASVEGTFSWVNPNYIPTVGSNGYEVIFRPTDTKKYNTVTITVSLTVNDLPKDDNGDVKVDDTNYDDLKDILDNYDKLPEDEKDKLDDKTKEDIDKIRDAINQYEKEHNLPVTPSIITNPMASDIMYGATLSTSQLTGGQASVEGAFTWVNPNTTPDAGTRGYEVIFTPTDTTKYNTIVITVYVTVSKAHPIIQTVPTASNITYGQVLQDSQLTNGVANVPGTFSWKELDIIPDAGTHEYEVIFTPDDLNNYNTVTIRVSVIVDKATPSITNNPSASSINLGQTLANSQLTEGQASMEGNFSWLNPNTIPPVGTNSYEVIFTPNDSINYNIVTITVSLTVNELPKDDNGNVKVDDDNYDDLKDLIDDYNKLPEDEKDKLDDKTKEEIDKIQDGINQYEKEHNLPVTPSIITIPVASNINLGQTLANSILTGGVASVDGTFNWVNSDHIPSVGANSYEVIFTPTDTTKYNTVTITVSVTVNELPKDDSGNVKVDDDNYDDLKDILDDYNKLPEDEKDKIDDKTKEEIDKIQDGINQYEKEHGLPITPNIITIPTASNINLGQTLANSQLTGGKANVEGTFSWVNPNTIPPVGTNSYEVIFTPTASTKYNIVTITVSLTVNELPKDDNGNVKVDDDNYDDLKDLVDDYDKLPEEEKDKVDDKTKEEIDKIKDAIDQYEEENKIKTNPIILTKPNASNINLGQTLANSILSSGKANVEGTFSWVNPNSIPTVGRNEYEVIFTPTNLTRYNTVTITISVTVNELPKDDDGNVKVDDDNYDDIKDILDDYDKLPEEDKNKLDDSTKEEIDKIRDGIEDYQKEHGIKTDPIIITNPSASKITYGQYLSNSTLSGGKANVEGEFTFSKPKLMPKKGTQTYEVVFTPTKSDIYNPIVLEVEVEVEELVNIPSDEDKPIKVNKDNYEELKEIVDNYNNLTEEEKNELDPEVKEDIQRVEQAIKKYNTPNNLLKTLIESIGIPCSLALLTGALVHLFRRKKRITNQDDNDEDEDD